MEKQPKGIVMFGLKYHRVVILVMTVLVLLGVYALKVMQKNEFPNITIREGVVAAVYPGATAEQMEQEVLKPLEDFIFSFKEVDKTSTHARATSGMVIVFVSLDGNVKDSTPFWNEFKLGLQNIKLKLPAGVLGVEALTSFGDTSSLLIAISSKDKTYRELGDMVQTLRDDLRPLKTVGEMEVYGTQGEQIAVYVDNDRLARYGLKANMLAVNLVAQGLTTTGGEIKGDDYTSPIYVSNPINSVYDIENLIVFSAPDGTVVRMRDVATVKREYPQASSFITNNGVKALLLSVTMKDGYNIVEMGDEVQKILDNFESTLPQDVDVFTITNQPDVVNASVVDFLTELLIAIVAVVIVIMVLLPLKVALIAAMTIPVTIFISLGFFYFLDMQLNTVTLACLIVSLGMIVDNAVVIIDNYVELISDGVDRKTATLRSARVFLNAIFSATMAISLTFFPFLFTLTGMFGDFITDFPWALLLILSISLIVAEMLVPYLQYIFIKEPIYKMQQDAIKSGKKKFSFFVSLQKYYDKLVEFCFRWPKTVLGVSIASIVVFTLLFTIRPMQLMPIAERNQFAVEIYLPTGTPLARTNEVADSLEAFLSKDKRVVSVASFHGCASPRFQTTYAPQVGGPNFAQFIVNTVSNEATIELLNEYTPKYESYFPDAYVRFKQLSYSNADYPIMVRVTGHDFKSLVPVADTILTRMRHMDGLRLVRSDMNTAQVGALVDANQAKASQIGMSNVFLEGILAMRYSAGVPVATVYEGDYGIPVVVKSQTADKSDVSALENEQIPVLDLTSVPLRQFAGITPVWDYGLIGHYAGKPAITLIAENERDVNTIKLTDNIKENLKDLRLPDDVTVVFGGEYENSMTILPEIVMGLIVAVFVIFFIFLFHYKQVRVTIILTLSLLLCIPGMAIGLEIMNMPISLTCVLGFVSLMGILVRNAIIMIDYTEELQVKDGYDTRSASLESAKRRMRPIFLTSSAATMGVLPMVISASGLWQPMGTIIFFGTPITMIFILTTIPVALWKFGGKNIGGTVGPAELAIDAPGQDPKNPPYTVSDETVQTAN